MEQLKRSGHPAGTLLGRALISAALACMLAFLGCTEVERTSGRGSGEDGGSGWGPAVALDRSWRPDPRSGHGLTRIAETSGRRLVLHTQGGDVDFVPGVNIGPTVPGRLPGEHAVEASDYRRWFPQIASLGLRSVRVYTVLPPVFYEELLRYNSSHPDEPLYLIQGVWIPEAEFYETHDLYAPPVRIGFKDEIADAVGAVHGDLVRKPRRGHASGTYVADVSEWLFAYSIGVEWDPVATHASDKRNAGRNSFHGEYFSSRAGATPTETWLAEMLDHTATEEAARGLSVPLTFTNWPTTDPLDHPSEPLEHEDLVGIDANTIVASPSWDGGFFASFHAYPYYPDFMRHEPRLANFEFHGRRDPYAGYLHALQAHFADMPLMITEYGVPSSLGSAHRGPLGRDQGGHSEQEQMRIDAELLETIHELGLAGAYVFEWTDEWFKFTWNTIEYELPGGRRQLWRNPLTNEENFGLVAMEPGERPVAVVDGDAEEWSSNPSQVIYESRNGVHVVRAAKDEAYLYLDIELGDPSVLDGDGVAVGFDVLAGGNGGLPGTDGLDPEADYAFVFSTDDGGSAWVRASSDPQAIVYGHGFGYIEVDEADLREGSGVWNLQRQILNRPLTVPTTGERRPTEEFDLGRLREGTSDPSSRDFDSRVLWARTKTGLEARFPYAMIGFTDPSSRLALRVTPDDGISTEKVEGVGISVVVDGEEHATAGYSWDPWNVVSWHERPKAGVDEFARAVAATLRPR